MNSSPYQHDVNLSPSRSFSQLGRALSDILAETWNKRDAILERVYCKTEASDTHLAGSKDRDEKKRQDTHAVDFEHVPESTK